MNKTLKIQFLGLNISIKFDEMLNDTFVVFLFCLVFCLHGPFEAFSYEISFDLRTRIHGVVCLWLCYNNRNEISEKVIKYQEMWQNFPDNL